MLFFYLWKVIEITFLNINGCVGHCIGCNKMAFSHSSRPLHVKLLLSNVQKLVDVQQYTGAT